MPLKVKKPTSPEIFSTKCKPDSTLAAKGEAAAARTLSAKPSPQFNSKPSSGTVEDKRRLVGAFWIKTDRIEPDPNQPRKKRDPVKQKELTESVRKWGILTPVSVRFVAEENTYRIIAGEGRFQAALTVGLDEVPCWIQDPDEKDVLTHQIIENWQRSDLDPYELFDALVCLRESNGYNQREIAKVIGKPESTISKVLSLAQLSEEVQTKTREGNSEIFSQRHLIALAQIPPEDQQEVMIAIEKKGLSAIETEKFLKQRRERQLKKDGRGSPLSTVFRYRTSLASVQIKFRKKNVSPEDVQTVLREVGMQMKNAEDF